MVVVVMVLLLPEKGGNTTKKTEVHENCQLQRYKVKIAHISYG